MYNIFFEATRGWKGLSRNCCARRPMEARSRIPPYRTAGAAYAASPCYAASQAFWRKKTRGESSRTLLGRTTKRRRKLQSSTQVPRCVATEATSGGWSRSRSAQPRASPGGKLLGASLWSTATSRRGGPYRRAARSGRKRFREAPDVESDWAASSQVTARLGPDGRPVRAVYGPKRQICEHVAACRKCSISTAYKYSSGVSSRPRKEDMCDYCDLLRRLRDRALRGAGAEADDLEGCGVVRQRFAALPPSAVAASDVADIDDLAAHETLAGIRQAAFKAEWAAAKSPNSATLLVRFDFSGALKVTDEVGTKTQYYRPTSCSCLGVVCANPGAGSVALLDPENRPHTTRIAAWQVAEAVGILHERARKTARRLSLWCDTGKHFRAPEFLHELLEGATTGQSAAWAYYRVAFEEIECNFFAEGHGQGECDAMFSEVKHAFAKYIATTDSRDAWKQKIERVARGATACFYNGEAPTGPRWRYCIPAISHAYRVGVKLMGGREVLLVEGKEAPAKVARIADGPEVEQKGPKVGRRDSAIAAAMRTKNAHRRRQGWA